MNEASDSALSMRELHLAAGAESYSATNTEGDLIDPAFGGAAERYLLLSGLRVSVADFINPVSVAETQLPPSRQLSLFLSGGTCRFSVEGGADHAVSPGGMLLSASSTNHTCRLRADPDRRYRFVSIGFNDDWSAGLLTRPSSHDDPLLRLLELGSRDTFSGSLAMTEDVRLLAEGYFAERSVGACRALIAEARALQIIAGLADALAGKASLKGGRELRLGPGDLDRLHEAKRLIDAEPETAFTLPVLARRAGLNVNKLKIGFKREFGETVGRYATRVRMTHARDLLASGDLHVASVAYRLGYNPTHFAVAFRRWFGVAPSQLRR